MGSTQFFLSLPPLGTPPPFPLNCWQSDLASARRGQSSSYRLLVFGTVCTFRPVYSGWPLRETNVEFRCGGWPVSGRRGFDLLPDRVSLTVTVAEGTGWELVCWVVRVSVD